MLLLTRRQRDFELGFISRRAAVFAIREQKADWIVNGLTAIAMIEKERVDFRDVLMTLGLLNHSATRIGENAEWDPSKRQKAWAVFRKESQES
jgi:hypothetical protein